MFNTLAWEIARYGHFRIELEGHTETKTNEVAEAVRKWELSTERANAARRKIITGGVGGEQIFKVSGFADTQPLPETKAEDNANRRVTVQIKIKESVSAPDVLKSELPNDAASN